MRQEQGYCSIRHDATSTTSFLFSEKANALAPAGQRGSTDCYTDFIGIPSGSIDGKLKNYGQLTQRKYIFSGNAPTYDRFCGKYFTTDTSSTTPQSIISMHFIYFLNHD